MKYSSTVIVLGAMTSLTTAAPFLNLLRPLVNPFKPATLKSVQSAAPAKEAAAAPVVAKPITTTLCLNTATATALVNGYSSLLTGYTNATALSLLTADFVDISQSINWLADYDLNGATFPNRMAFIAGQGSQPSIGFQVLAIDAIACNTVAFRWAATLFPGAQPIKGINILYANNPSNTETGWTIQTMYSEFNNALWNAEIGGVCAK